jgi:hypothetical protein
MFLVSASLFWIPKLLNWNESLIGFIAGVTNSKPNQNAPRSGVPLGPRQLGEPFRLYPFDPTRSFSTR